MNINKITFQIFRILSSLFCIFNHSGNKKKKWFTELLQKKKVLSRIQVYETALTLEPQKRTDNRVRFIYCREILQLE